MKEYIEKAALKERFQKRLIWLKKDVHDEYSKGLYHGCETDMGLIDEILAADVVEVRHGHWIGEIDDRDGHIWMECSECHKMRIVDDFCGACGTRMDKEDEQ